jgi:triacylglycerol lipase
MNLVFASGFSLPQQFAGINYFDRVEGHFTGRHEMVFPPVPPFGTIKERAEVLAAKIQEKFPQGPVHIIAHSMGGLDSRALIAANLNGLSAPGRIASLSTLSTPHRGSPVADLLAGPRPDGDRRKFYDGIREAFGLVGIQTGALGNLTTESASKIPDVAKSHPHIRYRSYFASGRSGLLLFGLVPRLPTSVPLSLTHDYIGERTGQDSDGLVALNSARYGDFQQQFWPCDHADIVGHDLDFGVTHFKFDHLAKIEAVVADL